MESILFSCDRWMENEIEVIYTMKYYADIKNDEITPLSATWIERENTMLNNESQRTKTR